MILLLGIAGDPVVRTVLRRFRQTGTDALFIPEARLHSALQLRWELPGPAGHLRVDGHSIANRDITAVLDRLRRSLQANLAAADDPGYVWLEWSALLYGWLQSLPCRVINRPRPGAGARLPEHRIVAEALHACEFTAPETLVTDSTDSMRRFLARPCCGILVSSPAGSGMAWHEPRRDARPPARDCPCRLQAAPRGVWRRVFVVGDKVFAAEAGMASLVGAVGEPWCRVALPATVARRCVRLARRLELEFVELLLVLREPRPVVFQVNDLPDPARCEPALHEAIVAELVVRLRTPQAPVAAGVRSLRSSGIQSGLTSAATSAGKEVHP